jgi:hypothetical protein
MMNKHNTLYISDLDGTLFNSDAKISPFTAGIINRLTEKGIYFSFATARSVYSAKPMTADININAPCILMNGVTVYDMQNNVCIKNEYIPENISAKICDAFDRNGVHCFMYRINNGILTAYFTEITSEVMRQFSEERKNKFGKPFVQCSKFSIDKNIVYFTSTGSYDELLPVKNEIDLIDGADCTFYKDTYTGNYYLEVFSHTASKSNGIKFLRENYGFENIICFGDNLNDLSMFRESDICVAVGNAKPEVKAAADFITLTNDEDGVAHYLRTCSHWICAWIFEHNFDEGKAKKRKHTIVW